MEELPEIETKSFVAEPWNRDIGLMKTCCEQMWIMGSLLQAYRDILFCNRHLGGGVHKVAKQMPGFGDFVSLCHSGAQQPIKTAGHHGEQEIAVDFHCYRRG